MSRDILDLIDNAIAGATSEDAMRWTPDAEKAFESPVFDAGDASWAPHTANVVGYLFDASDNPDSPWIPLGTVAHDGFTVEDVSRIFDVPVGLLR